MSSPITKELLETLTGCQVSNFSIEEGQQAGDGYLSKMFSVKVELTPNDKAQEEKETRQILFKCIPPDAARQSYLRTTNMFYSEYSFYQVWIKVLNDFQVDVGIPENQRLSIAVPPYVAGHAIKYSKEEDSSQEDTNAGISPFLENFVAMADMRNEGYRMLDKRLGFDLDHLNLAFTELAKMHALSWAYRNRVEWDLLQKFPCLRGQWDEKKIHDVWVKVVGGSIDTAVSTLDGVLGKGNPLSKSTKAFEAKLEKVMQFFLEQNEDVEKEAWKLHICPPPEMVEASKNEELWRVQLHGDTRGNNMLFKYDASGKPSHISLVDLQQTRQGCPTADLINLVYSVTTGKFRQAHMDSLLQLYCDKFTEYCNLFKVPLLPGFSFSSLKWRFHRAKPSGFMLAILLFPMLFMENSKEVNMEEVGNDDGTSLEEMFSDSFNEDAAKNALYRERILEMAQDLYDDGVI